MENCTCGYEKGDCVTIIGWDGTGESGCWARRMDQYIGISDIVDKVNHNACGKYGCTATFEHTPCH